MHDSCAVSSRLVSLDTQSTPSTPLPNMKTSSLLLHPCRVTKERVSVTLERHSDSICEVKFLELSVNLLHHRLRGKGRVPKQGLLIKCDIYLIAGYCRVTQGGK